MMKTTTDQPAVTPRERPILFSAPMVRAILDGTKTQTRRIVKPQPPLACNCWYRAEEKYIFAHPETVLYADPISCPYGQPGERLWVKETWQNGLPLPKGGFIPHYRADRTEEELDAYTGKWRPSIFMPRWASRITLEIESVRVERLQEISAADAEAEGCENPRIPISPNFMREVYRGVWEHINGKESWKQNPWVWALTFRRIANAL